jgi:hypothetical protein
MFIKEKKSPYMQNKIKKMKNGRIGKWCRHIFFTCAQNGSLKNCAMQKNHIFFFVLKAQHIYIFSPNNNNQQ